MSLSVVLMLAAFSEHLFEQRKTDSHHCMILPITSSLEPLRGDAKTDLTSRVSLSSIFPSSSRMKSKARSLEYRVEFCIPGKFFCVLNTPLASGHLARLHGATSPHAACPNAFPAAGTFSGSPS